VAQSIPEQRDTMIDLIVNMVKDNWLKKIISKKLIK